MKYLLAIITDLVTRIDKLDDATTLRQQQLEDNMEQLQQQCSGIIAHELHTGAHQYALEAR